MKRIPIPIELLKEYVAYDASSPSGLIWIKLAHTRASRKPGDHAGRTNSGCWSFKLHGVEYKCHRVIWALHYGDPAEFEIDHIDRNPLNNDIDNLRLATRQQNGWNRGKWKYGGKEPQSRFRGVTFHRGQWRVNIDEIEAHFDCELEAARLWNKVASERRGQFAILNEIND